MAVCMTDKARLAMLERELMAERLAEAEAGMDFDEALDSISSFRDMRRAELHAKEHCSEWWWKAAHEAGHAVVGHALGIPLECVSLIPDPARDTFGHVQPAAFAVGLADLILTCGGLAGERVLADGLPDWKRSGGHDYAVLARKLQEQGDRSTDPLASPLFRQAWDRAETILRVHRYFAVMLALVLMKLRYLTGAQITTVARRAANLNRDNSSW